MQYRAWEVKRDQEKELLYQTKLRRSNFKHAREHLDRVLRWTEFGNWFNQIGQREVMLQALKGVYGQFAEKPAKRQLVWENDSEDDRAILNAAWDDFKPEGRHGITIAHDLLEKAVCDALSGEENADERKFGLKKMRYDTKSQTCLLYTSPSPRD